MDLKRSAAAAGLCAASRTVPDATDKDAREVPEPESELEPEPEPEPESKPKSKRACTEAGAGAGAGAKAKARDDALLRGSLGACSPADWAVRNLLRLRSLAARPEHDTAVWAAGQATSGVHPHVRAHAVAFMYIEAVEWHLNADTLYSAVALLDRFLGTVAPAFPATENTALVRRVAMTCVWIACKLGEARVPALLNLVSVLDSAYGDRAVEARDLLEWERVILAHVRYCAAQPTAYHWLRFGGLLVSASQVDVDLAQYMMDLTAGDSAVVAQAPEKRAWAALWVAMHLTRITDEEGSVSDFDALHAETTAHVPPEGAEYVVAPPAVVAEIAYLTAHVTAAHEGLDPDGGVFCGHTSGGPWCSAATAELTMDRGFPCMCLVVGPACSTGGPV